MEDPTGALAAGLVITKGGGKEAKEANILNLQFTGLDPEDCEKVLTAIIQTYQDYLGETYQNVSAETVSLITQAKDELHSELLKMEEEYRGFRKGAPLMWRGKEGASVHSVRLSNVEDARSRVIIQRFEAMARREAIMTALNDGKSTRQSLVLMAKRLAKSIMEANALQDTDNDWESQLLPLEIERDLLLAKYGQDHPQVKDVLVRLQKLRDYHLTQEEKKRKANEAARGDGTSADFLQIYLESLRQEAAETEHQEAQLTALYDKEHKEAKRLEQFEVEDEAYRAKIDRTKALFNSVMERLQEINLVKEYGGYVTTVLSKPGPGSQVEPKLTIALGAGAAVGLLLGLVLGILVDIADKSFRSAEEIRDVLSLPVLAHIPVLDIEKSSRLAKATDASLPAVEPQVVTFHNSKSRDAESYRRVRTAIFFNTQGQNHQVIQVTSPDPSDGKTTLSTNLALSIAQSGKKVLLIDADFRRPKLHRIFGVSTEKGMTGALSGDQPVRDGIQATAQPGLSVLPCGPRPHNPAELLSSPKFREILADLRKDYDFIVVDTPPVLAVTDASTVAPCVDGVLVTIRLARGGRPNAKRAIEQLNAVGANVLGVVVNGVGGVRRYGYGYGYGAVGRSNYYNYDYARHYRYDEAYGYGKYGSYYADREVVSKPGKAEVATAGGDGNKALANGAHAKGSNGTSANGNGNGTHGNGHT
jgi:capsular exopolysaccharide synthesis family protein